MVPVIQHFNNYGWDPQYRRRSILRFNIKNVPCIFDVVTRISGETLNKRLVFTVFELALGYKSLYYRNIL